MGVYNGKSDELSAKALLTDVSVMKGLCKTGNREQTVFCIL